MTTTRQVLTLEQLVNIARRRIEVTDDELAEARKRRTALGDALRREFPGSRTYANGSLAHGDALTPLTDVDLGVVVPDPAREFGPGKKGPRELKERAANAIRRELKAEYGDLAVEVKGRKRSILVRFRDPVSPRFPDFTADVIVAIDNPVAPGLYIPRWDSWDRSHPERHTELVVTANEATNAGFARLVRLVKHWSRRHDKPLCSWNIKALALGCIAQPTELIPGMATWLRHAIEQLAIGETPDPAGVSGPIKLNEPRSEVLRKLRRALESLELAIQLEIEGYHVLAHRELAGFFNDPDMLAAPDPDDVLIEEARRRLSQRKEPGKQVGGPALVTTTGSAAVRDRGEVRSWGI
jgi:hypothetical protein